MCWCVYFCLRWGFQNCNDACGCCYYLYLTVRGSSLRVLKIQKTTIHCWIRKSMDPAHADALWCLEHQGWSQLPSSKWASLRSFRCGFLENEENPKDTLASLVRGTRTLYRTTGSTGSPFVLLDEPSVVVAVKRWALGDVSWSCESRRSFLVRSEVHGHPMSVNSRNFHGTLYFVPIDHPPQPSFVPNTTPNTL